MDESDLDRCVAAWKRGDSPARDEAARAIGIELDDATVAKLDALLEEANGKRRKFILTPGDLLVVVREACDSPHGIAVRHGGADLASKTTLALAVKPPRKDTVILGVASCWDRPSPGRIWKELQPWQADFARNVEKTGAWVAAKKVSDRVVIQLGSVAPAAAAAISIPASAGNDLLRRVLADPQDHTARLVYADWLTQRGDARGELITVQVALLHDEAADKEDLLAREKELLRKHYGEITRNAAQVALEMDLKAGFVFRIRATGQVFAAKGAGLFEHEPLEELIVSKPSTTGLKALAAAPHVARLRKLQFSSPLWLQSDKEVEALRTFLQSEGARALKELHLVLDHDPYIARIPAQKLKGLLDNIELPELEVLQIDMPGKLSSAWQSVAKMKLPALKQLVLGTRAAAIVEALQAAFPGVAI